MSLEKGGVAVLSLTETTEEEKNIEVVGISALDCEWNKTEKSFVSRDEFYPIPLGRVFLTFVDDLNWNDCNLSDLYGGDPITVVMKLLVVGGSYHFLYEE
jgi:hypothetical protein